MVEHFRFTYMYNSYDFFYINKYTNWNIVWYNFCQRFRYESSICQRNGKSIYSEKTFNAPSRFIITVRSPNLYAKAKRSVDQAIYIQCGFNNAVCKS